MAARPDRWHFTRELLQNTPSRKCGVEPEKELSYRQQSANLIQDMGQRLQVNQLCINTAIVYMHRFYMFQPFTRFPRNSISAACLFLAAKVEEQPHKLEHVLKVAHLCLHRSSPPLDPKSDSYMQQSQELVINESIILQTFAFDVAVSHPHTHVVKCTQMIRASKDLAQTSYFMATNSLHLTTFCLQYKPTLVACVCVHLACKWSQYEIPKSSDDNYWWEYVDPTVTVDLLNQLTMEFLQIIEACPNRLKRRITIHKEQTIAAQKNKKDGGAEDGPMASFTMKPGSQSSIDSGIAELDDPSKFHLLPHVGSPWLTKPSKDGERMSGEPAGKPSQSGRVPSKVDITENPQPTKKTIEEYRLEKEKKRKMQEVKVKEDRMRQEQKMKDERMRQEQKIKAERMRQAKIKQEKRKAYEAQQLLRDEAKVRPKIPPQVQDEVKVRPKIPLQVPDEAKVRPKIPPQLPIKHDHSVGRHHPPGERPNQPSSKAKLEAGGDQHGRHPKEHTFTSDRDKRHKPVPHPIEGGSSRQPQIKRQPPLPLSVHGKDSTRNPHYKEHHLKTAVPVKTEERKVVDPVKCRVGSNFKPPSDPKKLRGSPTLQKHQLKKDPVSVKSESTTSLLHKPHLLQEKTQAQRDEDQRLNDELSDIRDEIMKELENDANTNSVVRGSRSHPAPAAVEKKRNSLENLRQVAREELMHLKKSGIESKLHSTPLATNTATGSKLGADGTDLKSPVKVKEGNRSGHEQLPPGGSSHSPMKKLKSPVKIKRETPKSTTTSSGPLSSAKGESVSKKRALDLAQNALQSDDSSSFKKAASTPLNNSKQEKNNGPLRHLQVGVLLNKELESKPNNSLTTSGLPARKATTKNELSYEIEEGEISTSPIAERKIKSDMQNKFMKTLTSTSSAQGEECRRLDASHIIEPQLNQTSIVRVVNSTLPKRDITESVLSKDSLTPLKKENIVTEVINVVSGSQGSQQSPKHKHKHKEKKKHKKHRQEKPVESAGGSPNVESTSILTTSGGIKLKIKGLSSSFPGGSPSEPVKSEQMSNSAVHLPLKNASPISGKEKEHKHRHKHSKSKSHRKDGEGPSRKRSLSPQAATSTQSKKRLAKDGEDWDFHSELPGSLLSLPMPPPDPKKVSPSKHSTVKHKSRKHGIPPPPPPKAGKASPPPPPPPPPREPPLGEPLTTVTALPSMDSMPMDPYAYSNQYFAYPNAMLQGNGSLQSSSKSGAHRGKKQPRPPPYS